MLDDAIYLGIPKAQFHWQETIRDETFRACHANHAAFPDRIATEIHRRIIRDARVALDPEAEIKSVSFDMTDPATGAVAHHEGLTLPGLYRAILDRDVPRWREPGVAENVMGIIQRSLKVASDSDGFEANVRKDDPAFAFAYDAMSEEGRCDSLGGAESRRVYSEWIAAGRPAEIQKFIEDQANSQ